jgi:hypothetical protein
MTSGFNLEQGTYQLKAYFTVVLNDTIISDTLTTSIVINPAMSIRIQPESGETVNCLVGGFILNPTVTIYNTGNMDLSNVELILQIDTGEIVTSMYDLLKETYTGTILAGDSISYLFTNSYTVPRMARFYLRVIAYIPCDSSMLNTTTAITECGDIDDLAVREVVNPPADQQDIVGSTEQIIVSIENTSDNRRFSNVIIVALIEDENGEMIYSRMGNISVIDPSTIEQFTFSEPYTVPDKSEYYIRVYLANVDNYTDNDTLTIRRETNSVGIASTGATNAFRLGQNIPNPANNSTRIDYSVPEAGEVVFHVHSITGQLLYSKTIEASRGTNSIELNTSTFAAGVYFYSMEYKGQRLVRQLIISN